MVSFCHLFVLPCLSESGEREVDSAGIENPWHTTLKPQGVEFVTSCQLRSNVSSYLKHSFMQHVHQRSQCLNCLSPVIQVPRWGSNREKEISVLSWLLSSQSRVLYPCTSINCFCLSAQTAQTWAIFHPSESVDNIWVSSPSWQCSTRYTCLWLSEKCCRRYSQWNAPFSINSTPSDTLGATQYVNRYNTNKYYVAMEKAGSISYNLIKYQ